jgi:hypothetical protein
MAQVTITKMVGVGSYGPTGSFTSTTGRTYLAVLRNGSNNAATNVTSTNGIIFSLVGATNNGTQVIEVWSGVCTSGASGTVTATAGGSSNPSLNILELPVGAYVRQVGTNTSTSSPTSVTATIPAAINSESSVFLAAALVNNISTTPTPESGYATLALTSSNTNEVYGVDKEVDDDLTPSFTLSTGSNYAAIACECAWFYGSAISYIGQGTGTTTATLPTHEVGDLAVVFAYRDGNATAPTLPAGWTNINNTSSTSNSSRLAYKICKNTSETSGTWTNATSTIVHVYRGARFEGPIGGSGIASGTTGNVSYNTVSMTDTGNTSWVAGFAGHRSVDTSLQTAPSGMTNRSNVVDATDEAAGHDTNGTVSSWSSTSVTQGGTASGWNAITAEIRRATTSEPAVALSSQTATSITSTAATPRVTTNKNSGTIYMVIVADGDSPSVAQIKAGQNSSGAAAIKAANISPTASGVNTFSAQTGLTAATSYDIWYVHNWSSTDSTAVKYDLTTSAAVTNNALFWAFP